VSRGRLVQSRKRRLRIFGPVLDLAVTVPPLSREDPRRNDRDPCRADTSGYVSHNSGSTRRTAMKTALPDRIVVRLADPLFGDNLTHF